MGNPGIITYKSTTFAISVPLASNIWYVSDDGSDDNDCHSASATCRNLQTVLDRATDGADIYVTSDTLSLDRYMNKYNECEIDSPLSYTISHLDNKLFTVTCNSGKNNFILVIISLSQS